MKAVVFHGVGDIRLDEVPDPRVEAPTDAVIRITASAICGTDLHMIRGSMPGMVPGTVLGHEAVGVVEEVGRGVRNLRRGDRVVVPSTISCGHCSYCRVGYQAQCDTANPNGPAAGTAFYGGPKSSGPFNGLQAEYARVPYAHASLVKLPDELDDDRAILLSDIFPTGYFGADIAEIEEGNTVAVFGCGPVGLFAILSARLLGADRIIAVDHHADRLDKARELGAEAVDFSTEAPVEVIRELTGGIGVDRAIDAVGVDAEAPPAEAGATSHARKASPEARVAGDPKTPGDRFIAGDRPAQAVDWAVEALAKAGTLSIIGVYPPGMREFPIGKAMNKNLTINMGNANHRKYIPHLVDLVRGGSVDPISVLTKVEPLISVIEAYETFDQRRSGWTKVELKP